MIKNYTVDSTCNDMRLDRWLRLKLGKIPQSLIEKTLRSGKIKINKKKVKSSFKIKTTLPKAKVLKPQADKIITLGKKDNLHNTKSLVSKLQDIKSANKVKKTLSKRYEKRNGGYTRIIKAGFRYGDNAPMAVIEFVDRDVEAKKVDKKTKDNTKDTKKDNQTEKSKVTDKKTDTPKEATA